MNTKLNKMVKPRYINNEVIVPKPGPKQLKDESYFIGHAPYEEDTTEIEIEVEVKILTPKGICEVKVNLIMK